MENEVNSVLTPATIVHSNNLKLVLTKIVEETLNGVSNETFVNAYKTCISGFVKHDVVDRPSLKGSTTEANAYQNQFNDMVRTDVAQVLEDTLLTTMEDKIETLKGLIQSQHKNDDQSMNWRPPGNAKQHMIPLENVMKLDEKEKLEAQLHNRQEHVSLLKTRLHKLRGQLHENSRLISVEMDNMSNALCEVNDASTN